MLIVAGQDQAAIVGKELAQALQVRVVDSAGRVIKGQLVNFRVISGGGSVFAGAAITSDSGIAKERWTVGTAVTDSQRVEARAVDPGTGNKLVFGVFRATPVADVATTVTKLAGDFLGAVAGTAVNDSLAVRVTDRYGNPSPSASVTWTVTAGGGTIAPATGVTNASGIARARWTVGTRTDSTQRATVKADTLAPVSWSATVWPAAATQLTLTQSASGAASGAAFTQQPRVTLFDTYGNLAKSTTDANAVTMTVNSGATVIGGATAIPVDGVAKFATVGIGGTAGTSYTLSFASSGLASATQPITVTAGVARKLAVTIPAAGAAAGAPFTTQPVVSVLDAEGNLAATSTATVTMTVSTGATVVGTVTATAVNGVATFATVGIGGTAGTSYTLSFASSGLASATQAITPTFGAATRLAVTTNAAGAASGAAFSTQPVITIRDASGNTVTSAISTVTMAVSTGATLVGTATATAVNGVASFANVGVSGTAGTSYTLTFATSGLTSATQGIVPTYGAPTQLAVTTSAAGAASGAAFSTQPVITIRDTSGNTVTNSTSPVTMTVSAGATVVGTAMVIAVNGVATFSTVGIGGQSGTYTLTFTSPTIPPTTQSISLLTFTALSSLYGNVCGLSNLGAVYCWGNTNTAAFGQYSTNPLAVQQTGVTFASVAAGGVHSCGLTTTGAAYCWGMNASGSVGDNTISDRSAPVAVSGGLTFAALSAGYTHTCALTSAGAAYCWGQGPLGYSTGGPSGSSPFSTTPGAVQGGLTFSKIAAGQNHTCALTSTGAAYCWSSLFGGFCDGTSNISTTPTACQGGLVFASIFAAATEIIPPNGPLTCALTAAGAAYCWGYNIYGQVGDGTTGADRLTPVQVQGGLVFTTMALGVFHACGLTGDGSAYCWGRNSAGNLGDNSTTNRSSPVLVQGGLKFTALAAGKKHTCGLTAAGATYCWGAIEDRTTAPVAIIIYGPVPRAVKGP
ncbi:MAG: Ig-like domain-containing protein [Gemmatimonadetes bacterium]|nr:Ig-like domain-containing protein [Gemmatimonadota bacterium]